MKKLSLVLSGILLVAMGCGLKQDPLDGKPDAVRNGKLPEQKIEVPVPEASEAIRIDTVNKFTFVEGREDKISILARVLAPDYENQIQIVNMTEFQNASFDAATGVFTWAPPKGFIFDGLSKTLDLNIRVFSKSTKDNQTRVFTKDKSIEIVVEKDMGAPIIVKVDGVPTTGVKEGTSFSFTVLVRDEDAGPVQDSYPRLIFNAPNYGNFSLAPFIKITKIDADFVKREFLFSLSMDLTAGNITDGYSSSGFSIKAASRYNVQSAATNIDTKLYATYGAPKASWTNTIEIKAGSTFNYSFMIYESTGRADFEIVSESTVPEDAKIECDTNNARGLMPCTLTWTVPSDYPVGNDSMVIRVRSMKRYYTDVPQVEADLDLPYIISSPPPPPVHTPPNPKPPKTPKEVQP